MSELSHLQNTLQRNLSIFKEKASSTFWNKYLTSASHRFIACLAPFQLPEYSLEYYVYDNKVILYVESFDTNDVITIELGNTEALICDKIDTNQLAKDILIDSVMKL